MSGSVYDAEWGLGGPSDEGAAAEGWRLAQRLDGAREAFAAEVREKAVSPVLRALLASLGGVEDGGVR